MIARRLTDGRTEFALRLEGVTVKPRRSILPASAAPGSWYRAHRPSRSSESRTLTLTPINVICLPGQHRSAPTRPRPTSPDLVGWLNGEPTTIARELARGNVVLIDFWTFGCYNCQNTLPWLTAWDEKYRDHGLVILGVHRPEFAYEEDPERIRNAIAQYGIKYSVPLDNNARTWRAYRNRWWTAKYLIGPTDETSMALRYRYIGVGRYERTE